MNVIIDFIEENLFNQALISLIVTIICINLLSGLLVITAITRQEEKRMVSSEQFGFMGLILNIIFVFLHLFSDKLFGVENDILSVSLNTNVKVIIFSIIFAAQFIFLLGRSTKLFKRMFFMQKDGLDKAD